MNRCLSLVAAVSLVCLAGCSSTHKATAAASPGLTLDTLKSLEGEWTMPDEKGVVITAAVFKTTANGSAVREIMFPGTPHEMTNMYHMDGGHMLVTHYCAAGNQPRMRATAMSGKSIAFGPDSVTNLATPDAMYMGSMVMTFVDADHVNVDWTSLKGGKPDASHNVTFTMTRKKS